jgi:3-phenylpropionate/trans-cinnamate dioxygenase ferredoxin reductase subunit
MNIVILGNGISGITAARFIRKGSDHAVTVVSDESDYFFSRTALMYVYMGHLRLQDIQPYEPWFWEKNRIALRRMRVERIDFDKKELVGTGGETVAYDRLVLALGSVPNKMGWPGQDLDGVHPLYHLHDLEAMERHSAAMLANATGTETRPRRAVVVGGGLIGVEMAEMFHSRGLPVTFAVRESSFSNLVLPPEESAMVNRHILEHGIDLRLSTELQAIEPDAGGQRCAAVQLSTGDRIDCGFVGLTAGVSPNIALVQDGQLETGRGILVDEQLQTSRPGVFAVGDCAELRAPRPGRRSIEPVWYTGRLMGQTVARTLCGQPTAYDPGIWFNSAKFFDIEYQIYGDVPAMLPPDQETLYWEHPDGRKSIRVNYRRDGGAVAGFNLMGVRYRQEVCERWIRTGAAIETVLTQLGLANFDPEFSDQYEAAVVEVYNRKTGRQLRLKQRRGLDGVLRFLGK